MDEKNTLEIENFGPIKEAEIEIAPLTVLIGPNYSGKTDTSLAIHSFKNLLNKTNTINQDLQMIYHF